MAVKPGKTSDGRNRASRVAGVGRWEDRTQDRLAIRVPKGRRDMYHEAAEGEGLSLRAWVIDALDKRAGIEPDIEEE